jgi:hypothetical protein
VLADLRLVGRNCAINQKGINGIPFSIVVSHYVKKINKFFLKKKSVFVTLVEPQDPRFLLPTHLHERKSF